MKAKLAEAFSDYADYHRNETNQRLHAIGIPLIVFGTFGFFGPNYGLLLWLAVNAWYLSLDARLGAAFAIVSLGLLYGASGIAGPWLLALFVAGWVIQGVGHYYEGRSPAFFKNAQHLLIGPLWVLQKYTRLAR